MISKLEEHIQMMDHKLVLFHFWTRIKGKNLETHLTLMDALCGFAEKFQLKESHKLAQRLKKRLEGVSSGFPVYYEAYSKWLGELDGRIQDELDDITFGYVPRELVEYFDKEQLFGEEIAVAFPRANSEITTAGNCYAHGLNTAAVFHLMRAVEIGAKLLVGELDAAKYMIVGRNTDGTNKIKPVELCDWNTLIKGFNRGVKDLEPDASVNVEKKAALEYYSQVIASFDNFRDAWRNRVSHSTKIYLQGETKDIMENTKQFMKRLAERLEEPKDEYAEGN